MTEYETKYGRKLDGILICLEKIKENLGINDEDVGRIIGANIKEYEEIKSNGIFSDDSKERAVYFIGAHMGLCGLFENNFDAVKNWFIEKQTRLSEKSPLEIILDGSRKSLNEVCEYVFEIRGLR